MYYLIIIIILCWMFLLHNFITCTSHVTLDSLLFSSAHAVHLQPTQRASHAFLITRILLLLLHQHQASQPFICILRLIYNWMFIFSVASIISFFSLWCVRRVSRQPKKYKKTYHKGYWFVHVSLHFVLFIKIKAVASCSRKWSTFNDTIIKARVGCRILI